MRLVYSVLYNNLLVSTEFRNFLSKVYSAHAQQVKLLLEYQQTRVEIFNEITVHNTHAYSLSGRLTP